MTSQRYISSIIHGPPGAGKTTLANSLPGPRITLDTEGGSYDLQNPHAVWDIINEDQPPEPEGGWDGDQARKYTVIVDVPDWETYRIAMDYVTVGDHPFESVILDSLTEIQTQLKETIAPQLGIGDDYERTTHQVWDQLLVHLERDVRKLRNLTRPSSPHRMNTCIVVLTDTEMVPRKPLLQGSLRKRIPQFAHMIGYLDTLVDPQGKKRRVLQIEGSPDIEAKCNIHLINEHYPDGLVYDPNLRKMLTLIKGDSQ